MIIISWMRKKLLAVRDLIFHNYLYDSIMVLNIQYIVNVSRTILEIN